MALPFSPLAYTRQPPHGTLPHPYWIARGLVYADNGGGAFWTKSGNSPRSGFSGGPLLRASQYGISTGYGATLGSGTTDRTGTPAVISTSVTYRSIVSFSYALSTGGGTFGRIFQPNGTTAVSPDDEAMYLPGATAREFLYNRCDNASLGQWAAGDTFTVLNRWRCYGVSRDQTNVSNAPLMYINGAPATVTTVNTPVTQNIKSACYQCYGCLCLSYSLLYFV